MKKITIFAIILMPLIACCILFLSGTIINKSTYLSVESIEFVQESVVLSKISDEDVSLNLQVNVFPLLASNKTVEYWSGDESVVTVDSNGTITSQGFGETYIYARSKENSTKRASCKVVVTSEKVHRVWAENPISTMYVGDTHTLNIKYEPADVSDVEFIISSSDEDVVYASQSGELIAKDKGKATITIQLVSDPSKKFSFDIEAKIKVQQISADTSAVQSGASQFTFPKIDVVPANANFEVEYSSSDETIATVDRNGNITFLRAGEVKISAQVEGKPALEKWYESTFGYYTDVQFLDSNKTQINYEEYRNKVLELAWTGEPSSADVRNISFVSDNSAVIEVENNQFKVVDGGMATILLIAKTSETTNIERKITITVNRKADDIVTAFSAFQYTTQKSIDLDFEIIPASSTEQISYLVSDGDLATVEGNKLLFSQKAVNNKYAKVTIIASTPSRKLKSITFAYIDSAIRQVDISQLSSINMTMQKTGEELVSFALVTAEAVQDVEFGVKSGAEFIAQNGYIFTLKNNGSAQINVYFNGEQTASKVVEIIITRQVEQINDIEIVAQWDDDSTQTFHGTAPIYSTSKTFKFGYSLYPQNTTLSKANVQILGDSAQIVDGTIQFIGAGKITLVLSADDVTKQIEIESTYLHPDSSTDIESTIMLDKGQSVSIYDYIVLQPQGADKKYIEFTFSGDSISLDDSGNIDALCGGESTIYVAVIMASKTINKQIVVVVQEKILHVEEIKFKENALENNCVTALGNGADGKQINLVESYGAYVELSDEDAQEPYQIEYSVRNADSRSSDAIAYIQDDCLYFSEPGRVVITFKIGDKEVDRTLESTMGYAKKVQFADNNDLIFEFVDKKYTIPSSLYSIYPADAYKANVRLQSDNTDVFNVENNAITFVGGGNASLCLSYSTDDTTISTIQKQIYIKNRAQAINFFDGDDQVAYMVKDMAKTPQLVLNYQIVGDGHLSDYNIIFSSSNPGVATINNGIINFVAPGQAKITVKVQESLNQNSEETQDQFDAVGELILVVRQNCKIFTLRGDSLLTIEYDDDLPYIVYPISDKPISEFDFYSKNSDVVTINEYGEITKLLGGNGIIKVGEKGGEEVGQLSIYVHRKAHIDIDIDEIYSGKPSYDIYTSKDKFDILSVASVGTADARVNKTIRYLSSDTTIAQINGTIIEFAQAGKVTISIEVVYNGEIETRQSFIIYSSLNKIESFDITSSVAPINGSYVLYVGDDPIEFEVTNIKPRDYGAQIANMFFASSNSSAFALSTTSSTSFKLSPTEAGSGNFTFRYDNKSSAVYKSVDVEIKQWSTAVQIKYNNQNVDNITTLENTIDLMAIVGPTDATIKTVSWEIADNSIAQLSTLDANNARIVFTNTGTIVVIARATDGKSSATVTIEYKDLNGFKISTTQAVGENGQNKSMTFEEYQDVQTVYLNWNQTSVTFKIIALIDGQETALTNFSNFTVDTQKDALTTIDSAGYFTIYTASVQESPIYEDVITVSYSSVYSGNIAVKIYRDGLQAIDFGDHNEVKDEECGLQQMRVYGNKSYYNGIKNYYTMDVNIINNNAVVLAENANSTNFVNQVVWEVSDPGVKITSKASGYINIDFTSISTINNFDDIYSFDSKTGKPANGTVTVYAKNKAGRVLAQYTFIVVDAVNIFDQDGYLNAGTNIVLQKSFGHNDQQTQIDSGKYVKLEAYVAKDTIYGNGHLMNFAYRNTFTSEMSYENIKVSIQNIVNLRVQGANYDSTYNNYNIELTSVSKMAYSDLYYMYRSIEISGGTVSVRKCLLRSFKSSGIIGSAEDEKNLYLEDIIMYDVGQRAIELQKNATAYIKGFLDVYNFQNKDNVQDVLGSLGKADVFGATSTIIMNLARDNNLIVKKQNKEWVNMVGISTKGTDLKMYYYNYDTKQYEYKTDGTHDSAPGLIRVDKDLKVVGITAWSYTNTHEYLTWEHEYLVADDGTIRLNFKYLISTTSKISRLGEVIDETE